MGLMGETGETTERIVLLCQNRGVQRRGREVLNEKKENIYCRFSSNCKSVTVQ